MAVAFQLTNANLEPTELKTVATVSMEKQDAGWTIVGIALDLNGKVPGIDAAKFAEPRREREEGLPALARALGHDDHDDGEAALSYGTAQTFVKPSFDVHLPAAHGWSGPHGT